MSNSHLIISPCPDDDFSALPEKFIGTKGLRKKIIRKGNSWQTPSPGDEIEVHYSVSLEDGKYFDSSYDKEAPFKFKLGQCEVIKGWDEGIGTMRKGERALFTISPELAYGDEGSPPYIPPNSTLVFDIEMITWYPIRDVTDDGGVLKKITQEGEGWATPRDADEVLVKYVARCDKGTIISQSDEGIEFSLMTGHLCPAVSKAVKTMRKGERAELSVKPTYGVRDFGDGNSEVADGVIPSYSTLIIQIELTSWTPVIDVTGDRKILKKIITVGEGFDRPNQGSLAKVIYTGKLKDGSVFERKGSDEEPFQYICAEEQINEGLDRAVMTMKKGEEAIVGISSDPYNGHEVGQSSSAVSVLYQIKLIDFIKEKPFWKMDIQERMEACERIKHDGNELYKAGKFQQASNKYDKECDLEKYTTASKYIEYDHSFSENEKRQANSLRLSCYLNSAACKLKLGEYPEAARICSKVLEINPSNVKALFRRSQAYMRTSDLEKAEMDIKRALAIDPNNRDLKLCYKALKDKKREYAHYEVKIFSTMVSGIS